ncbi:5'-3' exonuclease PLD4 isoform X3 [Mobula hypostoma]|uniref:5'-3' exonuclease PLD4 isoform X3 n=1 Tax=Mobula hypostoma TaxID=723540 RepID=UPI002FC380AB
MKTASETIGFSMVMKPFGNLYQLQHMLKDKCHRKDINKWELGFVAFLLLMILCLLNFAVVQMVCKSAELPSNKDKYWKNQHTTTCDDPCRFVLIETVPDGLVYAENATGYQSIYNSWMNLINMANSSLDIASFYWTLTGSDINVTDPTSKYGEIILDELGKLPLRRVNVRVASSILKFPHQESSDLKILKEKGIQIRNVNFQKIMHGVLHSKLWIVDKKHLYIGSANMDWRALTQSSPPRLCPKGRTTDIDAILSGINAARKFLYISVMEYFPTSRFLRHVLYWPLIDDSLRKAAIERRVHIQLLVGYWKHSDKSMLAYLQSLQALRNVKKVHFDVKIFIVPLGKFSKIPYARVSHAKYFVTENIAYIGTSNWSYDYFNTTTGVGLLINQTSGYEEEADNTIHYQLKSLFQRDWNSNYSITLDDLEDDLLY